MSYASILVVEDEAIVAANIEMRLSSLGYSVPAVVDSGDDALQAVGSLSPDLVLMDIRISGEHDGIETAERIRTEYGVPVIYLTAYTDEETIERARQTEPYGYILKPFEVRELRTAIELALYRHTAERQQHARQQWFETTLQGISDAVITTDTQGCVSFMNPAAEELTGWRLASAVGRPIGEVAALVDEASGSPLPDPVAQTLSQPPGVTGAAQQVLVRCGDATMPVESRATRIYDDLGGLLGVALVLRDLRERRAIQARLRLIEVAVQQIDEIVVLLEGAAGDPRIVFVNTSFTRMTGYTPEQAIGSGLSMLYGPSTQSSLLDQTRAAFAQGRVSRLEGLAYRKGGETFQAEWTLTPLRDPRGAITHWVALLRDITRQRREQEVRWQRQKLESLGVLAGGIAHDFNNLLAVVLGNASMAMLELPAESPVRELIAPIESAARRAAALTRQMLAYAGHDRLSAQALDLNALVLDLCGGISATLPAHITLQTRLEQSLPFVVADVAQIRRVLRNLLVNAQEAIGDSPGALLVGTGLRRLDREFIASTYLAPNLPPGDYLALTVSDTGAGMDADVLARVFEPFFTTKFAGRGLGLAEVLGIVSAHRGTIKVESAPGRGTSCTVLLPIATPDQPEDYPSALEPGRAGDATRGLVLVIEDDAEEIVQLGRALERGGYVVLKATDQATARDLFASYTGLIRAVLLDGGLAGGHALLREIRAAHPDTCALVLTARDGALAGELAAGATGVIQRPCSADELRAAVSRALR